MALVLISVFVANIGWLVIGSGRIFEVGCLIT